MRRTAFQRHGSLQRKRQPYPTERPYRRPTRAVTIVEPVAHRVGPSLAKQLPQEDAPYRKWIVTNPCCVCARKANHAHHVRTVGAGGQQDRRNLVPLCWQHHGIGHNCGWVTFQVRYGVTLATIALQLDAIYTQQQEHDAEKATKA